MGASWAVLERRKAEKARKQKNIEKTNENQRFWPLGALWGGILKASWGVSGGLLGSSERIVGRWRHLEAVLERLEAEKARRHNT